MKKLIIACVFLLSTSFCFGQSKALFDNFKLGDNKAAAIKLIAKKYPGFKIKDDNYTITLKDKVVTISFYNNAINDISISYGKITFAKYLSILTAMKNRFGEPKYSDLRDNKYTFYWYEKHPKRSDWAYDIRVTIQPGRDFIVEEFCFINR